MTYIIRLSILWPIKLSHLFSLVNLYSITWSGCVYEKYQGMLYMHLSKVYKLSLQEKPKGWIYPNLGYYSSIYSTSERSGTRVFVIQVCNLFLLYHRRSQQRNKEVLKIGLLFQFYFIELDRLYSTCFFFSILLSRIQKNNKKDKIKR